MPVLVRAAGLQDLERFMQIAPSVVGRAASIALNDTARGKAGMRAIKAMMSEQVRFPSGYLSDSDRIGIESFASVDNLKVSIAARERPTSLARFLVSGKIMQRGQTRQPVKIQVKPGHTIDLGRAFLIRLRGAADSANTGLALRLKPGERLRNKLLSARPLGNTGLILLYGPSVDQVFQTVAADVVPGVLDELQVQFLRQFARLSGTAHG